MDALRENVRAADMWPSVCLPRMSRAWVPSTTVALVGPHASMPDDVRLSDCVVCVCDLVRWTRASGRRWPRVRGFRSRHVTKHPTWASTFWPSTPNAL
eukprot:4886285-Prymnesium_polylepis.1